MTKIEFELINNDNDNKLQILSFPIFFTIGSFCLFYKYLFWSRIFIFFYSFLSLFL